MDTPNYIDWIEPYLAGKLTETERSLFESELRINGELRQAVLDTKVEHALAEEAIGTDIRNQYQELRKQPTHTFLNNWKWLLVISGILLLGYFIYYNIQNKKTITPSNIQNEHPVQPAIVDTNIHQPTLPPPIQTPTPRAQQIPTSAHPQPHAAPAQPTGRHYAGLTKKYYRAPDFDVLRSDGKDTGSDAFQKAVDAWYTGDFHKVIQLCASILDSDSRYYDAQLLVAHASYRLGNITEALRLFTFVAEKAPLPLNEEGEWYAILMELSVDTPSFSQIQKYSDRIQTRASHTFHEEFQQLKAEL